MTSMNLDVIYEVLGYIKLLLPRRDQKEVLSRIGSTCSGLNTAVRPSLFRDVWWPHQRLSKAEVPDPLPFLPETVWPLIHEFHFEWPEEWPDVLTSPADEYHPEIFNLLDDALPNMPSLRTFYFTLPFAPPTSTLNVLFANSQMRHLRIVDTPITMRTQLRNLTKHKTESFVLWPVAEAMRMGEGPFNPRLREMQYFTRPYRREHGTKPNWIAGEELITRFQNVRYLHISIQYLCNLQSLTEGSWPMLETLVLTGSSASKKIGSMVDVVYTMPKLRDLRILLAKPIGPERDNEWIVNHYQQSPTVFSTIQTLALSNSYETELFLRHASSVERLSISAVLRHPQIPIGMKGTELNKVLKDLEMSGGSVSLKKIRLMTEDELTVVFFRELGHLCPNLEFVEVERCGYQEGEVGFEWTDYGEVFSEYTHLQELRVGIPFADCDEDCETHPDNKECIRSDRQDLAIYLASSVPSLQYIGFEYRTRTGGYRKEDRWLDYEILRAGEDIHLTELLPTWYEFPEVWERRLLHD